MKKGKPKSRKSPRFIKVEQVLRWMQDNIADDCVEAGHKTLLDALSWYVSRTEADNMRELSSRELAEVIQYGVGPYRTKPAIQRWLQGVWDGQQDHEHQTYAEAWSEFTRDLTEFYVSAPGTDVDGEEEHECG
jgi:hypothetical protein